MTDTAAAAFREMARVLGQRGDEDLLSIEEAAAMLGHRSPSTLRYWRVIASRGSGDPGPPSFKVGRRVVYQCGEVRAWIAQQKAASAADS